MTTVLVAETDSTTMSFQKDEDKLVQHLESLADQVLTFENDVNYKNFGGNRSSTLKPILNVKPG